MSRYKRNQFISRLMALLLALGLLLPLAPTAQAAQSGTCGENLTWSFDSGKLTISGSGDMTDYTEWDLPPWYGFREDILWLSLPQGLTSVGDMAFYDCTSLTAVTIPSTVTDIGELAFCQNRSMTILSLGSSLVSIGRSAFEQCESLRDLRLPDTLTNIGIHAFYYCTALQYVIIPASVTSMGSGTFAYCKSLLAADVYASVSALPTWTFYGCEKLSSVYLGGSISQSEGYAFYGCESLNVVNFNGTEVEAEQLREQLNQDIPQFDYNGTVLDNEPDNSESSVDASQGEDGSVTFENSEVTVTENSTIDSTISTTYTDGTVTETEAEITATITNPEGWNEVLEQIQQVQEEGITEIDVTVYDSTGDQVPEEVLNELKGSDVSLTVQTQSGSNVTLEMQTMEDQKIKKDLDLSYTIKEMEKTPDELNGAAAYEVTFNGSSSANTEVMIRLPGVAARSTASLYTKNGGSLTLVQAVMMDDEGYAHFYLSGVDSKTDYIIGINVPDVAASEAIVPENLYSDYGIEKTTSDVEYVVTGRSSSWGISFGQVTGIMVILLVIVVVIVGVVMYVQSKRKQQLEYLEELRNEHK